MDFNLGNKEYIGIINIIVVAVKILSKKMGGNIKDEQH